MEIATIGDIINELSTTTPLGGGQTFTSNPFVMAEYNSMSMIYFSDQPNTITVNWSADGVNWDYKKTYSLYANTPDQISMITYSKWCYIKITNTGDAQTVLRFEIYGTTSNNAVSSNIQGNTSNVLPEFSVSNSFDYNALQSQHVESWYPQFVYNFAGLTGGNTGMNGSDTGTTGPSAMFNAGYSNLNFTFSSSVNPTGYLQNLYWFDGSSMILSQQAKVTACQDIVQDDKFLKLYSGVGNRISFTAAMTRDETRQYIFGGTGQPNLWAGAGYANGPTGNDGWTNPIQDGLFFGYYGNTGSFNFQQYQNAFGVIYVNGGNLNFYPQSSWNVDKCDGVDRGFCASG